MTSRVARTAGFPWETTTGRFRRHRQPSVTATKTCPPRRPQRRTTKLPSPGSLFRRVLPFSWPRFQDAGWSPIPASGWTSLPAGKGTQLPCCLPLTAQGHLRGAQRRRLLQLLYPSAPPAPRIRSALGPRGRLVRLGARAAPLVLPFPGLLCPRHVGVSPQTTTQPYTPVQMQKPDAVRARGATRGRKTVHKRAFAPASACCRRL